MQVGSGVGNHNDTFDKIENMCIIMEIVFTDIWKTLPEDILINHIFCHLSIDDRMALNVKPKRILAEQKLIYEDIITFPILHITRLSLDQNSSLKHLIGNISLNCIVYSVEYRVEDNLEHVLVMYQPQNGNIWQLYSVKISLSDRGVHRYHIIHAENTL